MTDRRTSASASTALMLALCAAAPIGAQDQDQDQGPSRAGAIEEVLVTARKTEERLQDVPVAVTAITAEDITERAIRGLGDIATLTPGLNFEEYTGGFGTPVIRGAAQARIQDLDQNVSTFFDGIYLPRQYLVSPGVIGLERVEVVKGPQSALYGRNAFMGAINYITRKPGDEFEGTAEATVGNDERWDIIGEIGGPIVPGKLFARIGGGYSEFDGDADNAHPNASVGISPGSPDKLGGWENKSAHARLVWQPIESLEIDFGAYRFEIFEETRPAIRLQRTTNDLNCSPTALIGSPAVRNSLFCGELPFRFSPLPNGSPAAEMVFDPRSYGMDLESTILRGHAEWSATETLGVIYEWGKMNARVNSAGVSDRDPVLGGVNPFAPTGPLVNVIQATPNGDLAYDSHELRVEFAPTEALELMLGGFLSELHDFDEFLFFGAPRLGTTALDTASFFAISRGRTDVDTWAVFGRASIRIGERLRLGAEARYAEEDKTLESGPSSFSPARLFFNDRWDQFTPRFSIDYRLADAHLLYVSAAKGAKSGGFNTSAILASERTFEPDENWSYEIGSKNDFLDGRLRLNAAIFYIDWKNQQVSCSVSGSLALSPPARICNLGEATVQGIELDGAFALTEQLRINYGLAYNDATYEDGVVSERLRVFRVCDGIVCPTSTDIGGNELARQSKVSGLLGLQYEAPVTTTLGFFANLDAAYKSKQYAEELNLAWLPDRTLLNARFGLRGERWELAAWSKNLTDEAYASSAFFIGSATDVQYIPIWGQRRTYGLTGLFRF